MPLVFSGTNGVTFPDSSIQAAAASPNVLKNRIINGDMRIDQRNAGASVTANSTTGVFPVDRFFGLASDGTGTFTLQRSTVVPTGFTNSIIATVVTTFSPSGSNQYNIRHNIEGFNVADLGWGTANAQTVTLSFWVRSSVTGTYGGSLSNSAFNRSYPFNFVINAANTFEYKTITIAGDTTGTWLTDNGIGIRLCISLGAGSTLQGTAGAWASSAFTSATGATNWISNAGATFYITGVQLEQNTSATPFERRLYNQELANCQRYYQKFVSGTITLGTGFCDSATQAFFTYYYPVTMRTAPSALEQSGTASDYAIRRAGGTTALSTVPAFSSATTDGLHFSGTVASGLTSGQGVILRGQNSTAYLGWSAEL
jgi:hypothetical protein